LAIGSGLKQFSLEHQKVFDHRAEREHGQEIQRANQ
jgi:hypothetical protein